MASYGPRPVRSAFRGTAMSNDDWVTDVRRWYESSAQAQASQPSRDQIDLAEIGYEAAHPKLQTDGWSHASSPLPADLR